MSLEAGTQPKVETESGYTKLESVKGVENGETLYFVFLEGGRKIWFIGNGNMLFISGRVVKNVHTEPGSSGATYENADQNIFIDRTRKTVTISEI